MISVKQADQIIAQAMKPFKSVNVPLEQVLGSVLREDVFTDRNLPPFDKTIVDGIALRLADYQKGIRRFKIRGTQVPGQKPLTLPKGKVCTEIMTGAVLPKGADCVIPVEYIHVVGKEAIVHAGLKLKKFQYIQRAASDNKKGDKILRKGAVLWAPQIGIAATVGKSNLKVAYRPSIAVISTGNELVGIIKKVSPYQVRVSNSYAVQAALRQSGFSRVDIFAVRDNQKLLYNLLKDKLARFDVVILSGGVSMGKFDFVPGTLKKLGVKVLFHKVAQKPGKPFWFGKNKRGKIVFALPGNPASTLACTYRYILPHLRRAVGLEASPEKIVLANSAQIKNDLTNFVPVVLKGSQASTLGYSHSGNLAGFGISDGFVELPTGKGLVKKGTRVSLYRWDV